MREKLEKQKEQKRNGTEFKREVQRAKVMTIGVKVFTEKETQLLQSVLLSAEV
jgi:prophage tail gpP-like protein